MQAFLLSVHVLASVVLIGPITVAASLFPRYATAAAGAPDPSATPGRAVAAAMHRISRSYTVPAVAVPVFGVALGAAMGVLGQSWLVVSMALTAAAATVLLLWILPAQTEVMNSLGDGREVANQLLRRLSMASGLFATLWTIVVVLMIVRPGSTTGV